MPHVATAVFKDRFSAERALQALLEAGIPGDQAAIIGVDQNREISSISGFRDISARDDLGAALGDLDLPDDERAMLASHLSRGRAILSVRVDRTMIERAAEVLDLLEPVETDDVMEQAAASAPAADTGAPLGAGLAAGARGGMTNTSALPGMGTMTDDTSTLGTSDLRTDPGTASYGGDGSTGTTGGRRGDERSQAPGTLELMRRGRVRIYGRG